MNIFETGLAVIGVITCVLLFVATIGALLEGESEMEICRKHYFAPTTTTEPCSKCHFIIKVE